MVGLVVLNGHDSPLIARCRHGVADTRSDPPCSVERDPDGPVDASRGQAPPAWGEPTVTGPSVSGPTAAAAHARKSACRWEEHWPSDAVWPWSPARKRPPRRNRGPGHGSSRLPPRPTPRLGQPIPPGRLPPPGSSCSGPPATTSGLVWTLDPMETCTCAAPRMAPWAEPQRAGRTSLWSDAVPTAR